MRQIIIYTVIVQKVWVKKIMFGTFQSSRSYQNQCFGLSSTPNFTRQVLRTSQSSEPSKIQDLEGRCQDSQHHFASWCVSAPEYYQRLAQSVIWGHTVGWILATPGSTQELILSDLTRWLIMIPCP